MSRAKKPVKSKVQSRARIWCFTINNPDEKEESHLSHPEFLTGVQTMIWQVEEGVEKTPHIQGVMQFKNQATFNQVKNKLPTAHIEICRNFPASKTYCQKETGRIRGPFYHPMLVKKMTSEDICLYWRKVFLPEHMVVRKKMQWEE